MTQLQNHFSKFKKEIIGNDEIIHTPYGKHQLLYADWIASGRLYCPIEKTIIEKFGPYVANTHSESSFTGAMMTSAYHMAQEIIKTHVSAGKDDIIINKGSGMTGVVNKLIRILGLRVPEQLKDCVHLVQEMKPVVFVTHIEHHSNQTSWDETIADVVVLEPEADGSVGTASLEQQIKKYSDRKIKIGAFSACSNVTGIFTPYHQLAEIMHAHGGYCFIDFACSAPYMPMNMHPENPAQSLDAIYFSPHKFLGGPGSPGIMIFNSQLYKNQTPDDPGGGTVDWTNPWGQHRFVSSIEAREDGGTPPFLQTIRAALAIRLKEEMNPEKIIQREEHLVKLIFDQLESIPRLHVLADNLRHRLGAISFYIEDLHYNLIVRLLNDHYGIQTRGGCSCAGTYGHYLLHVDPNRSKSITDKIDNGDLSEKPGWVRVSLHPTMSDDEVMFIADAIKQVVKNCEQWSADYSYDQHKNEFFHRDDRDIKTQIKKFFNL